jgi:hypothetical protein
LERLSVHQRRDEMEGPRRGGRLVARGLFVVVPAVVLVSVVPGPTLFGVAAGVAWAASAGYLLASRTYAAEKARYLRRLARLTEEGDGD